MNKLLVIGSVAYDSIESPFGKIGGALGGSASYISLAARFFAEPGVVAVVGKDFRDVDRAILKLHKIDLSGLETAQGKTFRWGGKYSFDLNTRETLFTRLNVFEKFKPRLSELQKKSEYTFLGNIHPKLQLDVLGQIRKPKLVGCDTMNYWIEKTPADLKKVLKKAGVLIINDSEARELSQEYNLLKAAKGIMGLMGAGKILVIKKGENGLLMFRNGQIFHAPGFPLEKVFDPTGAGDSFAGGFMGYLAGRDDLSWNNLKKACVYGSVTASFCVEKMGTKRLQEIKFRDVKRRFGELKKLTHFEI